MQGEATVLGTPQTRIMVIEDNPGDVRLVQAHLDEVLVQQGKSLRDQPGVKTDGGEERTHGRSGTPQPPRQRPYELIHHTSLVDALQDLEGRRDHPDAGSHRNGREPVVDVVLLDLTLPDSTGPETVRRFKARHPHIPVLVLTGHDAHEVGVAAVQAGAEEYLSKTSLDANSLVASIRFAIARCRLAEQTEALNRQELEHVRLEEESERLRAEDRFKSHLLNLVSHELRTPLTPIKLQYYLLRKRTYGRLETEERRAFDTLGQNLDRLEDIVNAVIDTVRIERGERLVHPRPHDIEDTVTAALDKVQEAMIRRQQRIRVDVEAVVLPHDGDRIAQCLTTLVDNAIRYSPPNSSILVRGRVVRRRRPEGHPNAPEAMSRDHLDLDDEGYELSVTDPGAGLEPGRCDTIFERFAAPHGTSVTEGKGTGLGLYIVRGIIEGHGGTIACASDGPGKGTTFWIRLPVHPTSTERNEATQGSLGNPRSDTPTRDHPSAGPSREASTPQSAPTRTT